MSSRFPSALSALFFFATVACSSPAAGPLDDAASPDPDASADASAPPPWPAPPQVVSGGGPIIATPTVVPVFFGADALQGSLESFLHALSSSTFWTATTKEYGIGALSVAPSVTTSDPVPTTDDALATWLAAQADGTHAGWPKADDSTVFVVFFPSSATLTIHNKQSCQVFDGYHKDTTRTGGGSLIYAPVMRCESGSKTLDAVTLAASHEITEAVTDPLYYSNQAWAFEDDAHFIWTMITVGEIVDMCDLEPQSGARLVGNYQVQRAWSNASALAGHDPCVPAPANPYFAAAAILNDSVTLDTGGAGLVLTKGVRVPTGRTETVDVVLRSDGPMDAWQVKATDTSSLFGGPQELQLALDRGTGNSGDVLQLTITRVASGPFGGSALVLTSTSAQAATTHVWLGFVEN